MTGIHMESSRNSCCFHYIRTFGGTYILYIPSKFNIMNIIIYIIHLKYSILPVLYCPPTFHMDSTWNGVHFAWNGVPSTWIPWSFHGHSIWIPYGLHVE